MHEVDLEKMLDELLEQLINRLKKLLKIIRMERRAIIHSDIGEMETVMRKKARLKTDINLLEKNRTALLPLLAKRYEIRKKNIVLKDLIDVMPTDKAVAFAKKRHKLQSLFNRIFTGHKANEQLLKKSMRFQEKMFMTLFAHLQNKTGYESNGEVVHSDKRLFNGLA